MSLGALNETGCNGRISERQQPVIGADIAPGTITLDVISPRAGSDFYRRYLVTPSRGQVVRSESGRQAIDQRPVSRFVIGPDCFKGEAFPSPDNLLVAYCKGQKPRKAPQITITDAKTGEVLVLWSPVEWRGVDSLAWSPNSRSVAVANHSEHYGKGILERVWAGAGHPVPHNTFYLSIADAHNKTTSEYLIEKDTVMGSARILDWSR